MRTLGNRPQKQSRERSPRVRLGFAPAVPAKAPENTPPIEVDIHENEPFDENLSL